LEPDDDNEDYSFAAAPAHAAAPSGADGMGSDPYACHFWERHITTIEILKCRHMPLVGRVYGEGECHAVSGYAAADGATQVKTVAPCSDKQLLMV